MISVIVPIYAEEKNIVPFLDRLIPSLTGFSYEVIFCLDPSPDNTEKIIIEQIKNFKQVSLIKMSRRFGQAAATLSGIYHCRGDYCIIIDVDLQDPPELIPLMVKKANEGFDVVYAKRRSRKGETFIKKIICCVGYALINKISETNIPRNTGDFRLISRRVIEHLKQLKETNGFLRGLVSFVGFPQTFIEYDREERLSGKGNYNRLTGSLKIGFNGIIGFSNKPLQLTSLLGLSFSFLSLLMGFSYFLQKLFGVSLTPGLPTTIIAITFFSGIQLFCLGIMGEYIGRIYDEVKKRPMYIIDEIIDEQTLHAKTHDFLKKTAT